MLCVIGNTFYTRDVVTATLSPDLDDLRVDLGDQFNVCMLKLFNDHDGDLSIDLVLFFCLAQLTLKYQMQLLIYEQVTMERFSQLQQKLMQYLVDVQARTFIAIVCIFIFIFL